jgi:hypothetical protein
MTADTARLEENVARLRELHAGAEGAEQRRAALLLGLAIAHLAEHLPDDEPRLPELAREGMLRLDERDAEDEPPSVTAAVEQSRQLLGKHLPRSKTATTVEMPYPLLAPEGLEEVAKTIDPQKFWHLTEALRFLRPMVPEGDPLQAPLRLMGRAAEAMDLARTNQWTPEHDQLLADVREMASAADQLDPTMAAIAHSFAAMLGGMRWFLREMRLGEDAQPDPAELDGLITEAESALDRLRGTGPLPLS